MGAAVLAGGVAVSDYGPQWRALKVEYRLQRGITRKQAWLEGLAAVGLFILGVADVIALGVAGGWIDVHP